MYKNFIKRILDIILSFLALVILSPLLILTAFLIRIKLGTPVFFKQLRPGKNEKIDHDKQHGQHTDNIYPRVTALLRQFPSPDDARRM